MFSPHPLSPSFHAPPWMASIAGRFARALSALGSYRSSVPSCPIVASYLRSSVTTYGLFVQALGPAATPTTTPVAASMRSSAFIDLQMKTRRRRCCARDARVELERRRELEAQACRAAEEIGSRRRECDQSHGDSDAIDESHVRRAIAPPVKTDDAHARDSCDVVRVELAECVTQ